MFACEEGDRVLSLTVGRLESSWPACVRLLLALVLLAAVAFPPSAFAAPVVADGIAGTNGAPVPVLDWGSCPAATPEEAAFLEGYQCTTAKVPLSYRDPQGQRVTLALGRLPAADPAHRLGTLFWNPGGPGGSGRIPPAFSQKLHERFDIVGFDPRGVAASTPLRCFESNQEALELFGWPFPITPAQERSVIELTRRGTQRCADNGGPIIEHMATGNVARDLDLLRQAVGDEQLSYLGFSYGTHLGEVYANLFPDRVRALTLDAIVDPVQWTTGRTPQDALAPLFLRLGSHEGAYAALLAFLRACRDDARCVFREQGRDLLAKYDTLLQRVRRQPVDITLLDGQSITVTYQLAVFVTLASLYDPSGSADLAAALQELYLATEQPGRSARSLKLDRLGALLRSTDVAPTPPGEPYLGIEQGRAVFCTDSDSASNPWAWPRYARAADRAAPYFGSYWSYVSLPCATWPARDADRYTGPWNRPMAHPLLLVGNRHGDPATPYENAVSASQQLASARLLTLDSYFGHGAFPQSQCIVSAVERYLIDLQLPPNGTVCQPDRKPFDPVPPPTRNRQQLEDALTPPATP
jgi:pimeloyl-ACP methyl ester carboxylesterase